MSAVSPITDGIFGHASKRPLDTALVIGARSWSWESLANEIEQRSKLLASSDPLTPTFTVSDAGASESALNGLARLHRGLLIIGTTSGSTAAAKLYRRSQDSWIASFEAQQREFPIREFDVVVAPGSLSHSLFSYALCHALFVGAKVILSDAFRPDHVLHQIQEHHGSVLYAVPTQLKLIDRAQSQNNASPAAIRDNTGGVTTDAYPMHSLRLLLSSGARWFGDLTPRLKVLFPKAEIIEFYGASETSFVSLARHSTDAHLPNGSLGKVFSDVAVNISKDGLISVHSPGLFEGYLDQAPLDFHEHTDANGRRWISVGDIGYQDAAGYLFLSGRQSRKIVTSGKNLYPEEIEECLIMHSAIECAAVFGMADDLRGERLLAAVAIRDGQVMPSRAALMTFLRPMLEDYKIPRDFVALDFWPMTTTGKTDFVAVLKALKGHL